jgi:hypothetical protein
MKKFSYILSLCLLLSAGTEALEQISNTFPESENILPIKVHSSPIFQKTEKLGLVLSGRSSYGAAQYFRNVLLNPGFEGIVDRILLIVDKQDGNSITDRGGSSYENTMWNGASYEVLSGSSRRTKGFIAKQEGATYTFKGDAPSLKQNDVLSITKTYDFYQPYPSFAADPVPQWWIAKESAGKIKVDPNEHRPLSPGKQSVVFLAEKKDQAKLLFYLDATASVQLGKFLLINGRWRLSFWMRSDTEEGDLSIFFSRIGNPHNIFFSKEIPVSTEWKEYVFDFECKDDGPPSTVQLDFIAQPRGESIKLWMDDVFLGPLENNDNDNKIFREEMLETIAKFQPSYIRDWQDQAGDDFNNRIADVYGRKCCVTHTGGGNSTQFCYSLLDLFDLCDKLHANPWIVIPPVFTEKELTDFGLFLTKEASKGRFRSVAIEFGNENWNWFFRPTGIPYPEAHGPVAQRAFELISQAAGNKVHLRKIVNGQYVNLGMSIPYAELTPNCDTLAVAPYYYYEMNASADPEVHLKNMFAQNMPDDSINFMKETAKRLKAIKKSLATYEVNMTTLMGNAPPEERNPVVCGAASGSALAKRALECLFQGAEPQCVFNFAQFSTKTWSNAGEAKLWGIVRDLSPTRRLRPTGLAVQMLNLALGGSLHEAVSPAEQQLTIAAIQKPTEWNAAIVSANNSEKKITLEFPDDAKKMPNVLCTLSANSPFDTNETEEKVRIAASPLKVEGRIAHVTIPAWGFVVLCYHEVVSP